MPIYEYVCRQCGHEMEALQKMSDPPLTDCPACGAAQLNKKISAVGFRLSGSGWYETDFKTGDKKKNLHNRDGGDAGKSGEAAAAKSEAKTKSDTKTENKPAAKPARNDSGK